MLVDQLAISRADEKLQVAAEKGYDMRYVGVHSPVLCKRNGGSSWDRNRKKYSKALF